MSGTIDRRGLLGGLAAMAAFAGAGRAAPLAKVKALGRISVAMYRDFEPWSWRRQGTLVGIDVEIAQALAKDMGLGLDPVEFIADEDVEDDLRNIVWRGSTAGGGVADMMMHVPIDREFNLRVDRAAFFAPYARESFAMAADARVFDPDADPSVFRERKVAVELDSVPDIYMLGSLGGRPRDTILHKPTGPAAVAALVAGEVPLVMATRAQIEHGLMGADKAFKLRKKSIPGLFSTGWDVGIAVKDDSRDLGEQVEAALTKALADGRVDAIFAKYGVKRELPKAA